MDKTHAQQARELADRLALAQQAFADLDGVLYLSYRIWDRITDRLMEVFCDDVTEMVELHRGETYVDSKQFWWDEEDLEGLAQALEESRG